TDVCFASPRRARKGIKVKGFGLQEGLIAHLGGRRFGTQGSAVSFPLAPPMALITIFEPQGQGRNPFAGFCFEKKK
ncbi:hypothetical protein, partial [Salmonella enterica]|uniref:hypothetical protein n=1 Tax=Salmonella enterica TaxID=28901 RepID=UPI001C49293E